MPKESFLRNRIRSVGVALNGMLWLFRNEYSIQIQCGVALAVTYAGYYYAISPTEWMLQCLTIGLVMGLEGLNTAVEKLSDYVQSQKDPNIGLVKDLSAGAVMLAALSAIVIGSIIYLPKIF